MSRLAQNLRHRMQILTPTIMPNSDGGFDRGFVRIGTVWAGLEPLSSWFRLNTRYIRDQQIERAPTHTGTVRKVSVAEVSPRAFGVGVFGPGLSTHAGGFGREFSLDFANDFRRMPSLAPMKADYFMFLENGSGTSRGRLFRIYGAGDPKERGEYLRVDLEEIEDHAQLSVYHPVAAVVVAAAAAEEVAEEGIYVGPIWDDTLAEWR